MSMTRKRSGSGSASAMMLDLTLQNYSQSHIASQGGADTSNSTMFFVIPKGQTEETCSKALMAAYRLSIDFELNAKLTTEEEVKSSKPKPGNVFVVDPFEGPAFHFLEQQFFKSKKFLIIGPQCIHYAMHNMDSGAIQSKGYPFYIMSMRNICVTLTGFDKDEQAELTDLVQRMNGVVSKPFAVAVTHVVAKNVITPKCYQAFKNEVPVMTAEWIRAVWKEGQEQIIDATDSKYVQYACGIFQNLSVCVSQVPTNVKTVIERIVTAGGGSYSKNFQRYKTNLLIVPHAGGDKYKYALEWKVPVVTPEWVEKSKEAGHVLPVDEFRPSERPLLSSTQISGINPRMPFDTMSEISEIQEISERTRIDMTGLTNMTILTNQEREEVRKEDIEVIVKAETFLDGCTVYLCNHDNEKLSVLRRVLNGSGAIRPNNLSDHVTHIVVINDLISDKEIKAIRALGSSVPIVAMNWLLECAKQRCVIDTDSYAIDIGELDKDAVPISQRRSRGSDHGAGRQITHRSPEIAEEGRIVRTSSRRSGDKTDKNVSVFQAPERTERAKSSQKKEECRSVNAYEPVTAATVVEPESVAVEDGNVLFAGLVFVVQLDSEEETNRISKLIRESGGEVVDENDGSECVIAILPPVYKPQKFHALKSFTKYWVEEVCEQQSLEIQELVHHSPFEANENLKTLLSGVVIATSAYSSPIKEFIGAIATQLGAVVQETFCRKNKDSNLRTTHLLCNVTDNDKFRAAQRWGTPVVFCEWITECYQQKKRLDHGDFLIIADSDSTSSVYMKTPKGEKMWGGSKTGRDVSEIPVTGKTKAGPSRIFGLGTKLNFASKNLPRGDGGDAGVFKTPVPNKRVAAVAADPPPVSPLVNEGMSREASRQLKRALELAADSFEDPKDDSREYVGDRQMVGAKRRVSTPLRSVMDDVDAALKKKIAEQRQDLGLSPRFTTPEQKRSKSKEMEENEGAQDAGTRDSGMDDNAPSPDEEDIDLGIRSKRAKVNSPGKRTGGSTGLNSTGYSTIPGSRKGSTSSGIGAHRISPSQANKFGDLLDDMVAAGGTHTDHVSQICWNGEADDAAAKVPSPTQPKHDRDPQPEPQVSSAPPPSSSARKAEPEKGFVKQRRGTTSGGGNNSKPPSAVKSVSKKATCIPKKAIQKKPKERCLRFAISGGTAPDKERYKDILAKLGAVVSPADYYDAATDAVIATKVARSEKILGSIAGGKPILHPTYLDDCDAQGKILEFDDYLWGEEHASTETEKTMTRVAQYWYRRLQEDPSNAPYAKFVVCLCEEKPTKRAAYARLIEAGGGKLVEEDDPEINIVIGEGREASRIAEEHQVPQKIPMFLNDVIITYDDPRVSVL